MAIPENYIFLPLQVATDTQILLNGRWVPSIREMLLAAIRQIPRLPAGWALVVKEHPSCRIKNADVLAEHAQARLVVSEAEDTFALVRGARGRVDAQLVGGAAILLLRQTGLRAWRGLLSAAGARGDG